MIPVIGERKSAQLQASLVGQEANYNSSREGINFKSCFSVYLNGNCPPHPRKNSDHMN